MNNPDCPFGTFDFAAREYVISSHETPRPWLNYIWNREFLSVVTQTGQGYGFHQDSRSLRTNIVAGRRIYLQDTATGETWSAEGMDAPGEPQAFECRHGLGYSIISVERTGIRSRLRIFVPDGCNAESWTLELENLCGAPRALRVVAVLDSRIDGEAGLQGYYTRAETYFDASLSAVLHITHRYEEGNPPRAFLSTTGEVTGYDARYDSFYGTLARDVFPAALRAGTMRNSARAEFEKGCFALETRIELPSGGSRSLQFFAGHYQKPEDIAGIHLRFASGPALEEAFQEARKNAAVFPQPLELETGEPVFDGWSDTWLKRQMAYNSTWARDYFNGYRDLCQDVENMAVLDPGLARRKLLQILSFQYPSGFAPRAWANGIALDHGHGDSPVWITFAVHALLMETGDLGLLDVVVPYYETDEGTVYDHCKRSLDWYWKDRGDNGLCLFRKGDWNDAMTAMGREGKGTSAWTTMAYHRALREFSELARIAGNDSDASMAEDRAAEIRGILEEVAWDGEWYLRGFTDAGDPVGSRRNREGRIYANAQSWAVIGGIAPRERLVQAMESLDRHLDRETGVLTIDPIYTEFDPGIGPITGQRPGAYQNGSVYSHTNLFKIWADCLLGRGDKAWRGIQKILPFSSDRVSSWGEPYVLSNCYFGPEAGYRHDRPGQSWMTASSGWLLRCLVRGLFGLEPTLEGLRVRPNLPADFPGCRVVRTFRDTTYDIHFERRNVPGIRVEGAEWHCDILPLCPGGKVEVAVPIHG